MESVKEEIVGLERELSMLLKQKTRNQVRVNRGRIRKLRDEISQLRIRSRRSEKKSEKTFDEGEVTDSKDV